ncbi:helix-turn-helix transcriptional regulator [Rhizobium sp. YIM 134829]|uniref:helix-turn-helix transcriptional regulator n=1 Tax=Rhizobium sp. YIM 134829 TaxID=3390453 RepID=UPI00397A4310
MVLPFRSKTDVTLGGDVASFRELCIRYGQMIGHSYSALAPEDEGRVDRFSNISLPEACATVFDRGLSRFVMSPNLNGLDLVMFSMPFGESTLTYEQRGRVETAEAGEILVHSTAEVLQSHSRQVGRTLAIALPRAKILPLVMSEDRFDMTRLGRDNPACTLLRSYADTLISQDIQPDFALADKIGDQLCDLAALALGASARGRERRLAGRALSDARLHRAKQFISRNLNSGHLNESQLSAHLAMSESAVRKLFAESGTPLARYIRMQRLERASRLLAQKHSTSQRVVDIALDCGFESLSAFYRAFRQAYGTTPSQRTDDAVEA